MADRIYKGMLATKLADSAFPEAAFGFDEPHAGGLVPFDTLVEIVHHANGFESEIIDGALWIRAEDAWVRIERDGTLEIGTSGV